MRTFSIQRAKGNNSMQIIIVSPSLNPSENVSGISAVTQFIIDNNQEQRYLHFELGRKDKERNGYHRIIALAGRYRKWKQLLSNNPNALIHYNLPLSKASMFRDPWFINYAIKKSRKIVIHVHGGLLLTAKRIPFYINPILKWIFSRNIPFIVLSGMERNIVMQRFGAKDVSALPNCVDLTDAKAFAQEKAKDKRTLPLHIGYLGRIEPNKGMTELLKACMKLKDSGMDFHLSLAGKEQNEGEYLSEFKRQLGDKFCYEGVVSGQQKRDFLRRLDVFILPTYFEGLPMSLLECMSYGIVPVTTAVGSIPQVVKDGVNGLLIKVHDTESITEALRQLDEDRDLLYKLGREARNTIFDKFSMEGYVEKLNDIYRKLLS